MCSAQGAVIYRLPVRKILHEDLGLAAVYRRVGGLVGPRGESAARSGLSAPYEVLPCMRSPRLATGVRDNKDLRILIREHALR